MKRKVKNKWLKIGLNVLIGCGIAMATYYVIPKKTCPEQTCVKPKNYRGSIFDRNRLGLATTRDDMCNIILIPTAEKFDAAAAKKAIIEVLGSEYYDEHIVDAIKNKKFAYVQMQSAPKTCKGIEYFEIPGLYAEKILSRSHFASNAFSNVLGFVLPYYRGVAGLEKHFDSILSSGQDINTTLDFKIQSIVSMYLTNAMEEYDAKSAVGIVMNSKTGEIVSLVEKPGYDPEVAKTAHFEPRKERYQIPTVDINLRTLNKNFEYGSIFKIFNTVLAYQNDLDDKQYIINEPYSLKDKSGKELISVHDVASFKPAQPTMNVDDIMVHSCNVGSAQIAMDLPVNAQKKLFHKLHFDEVLDLDFGTTEMPIIPVNWSPVERVTTSFGHGISVSPIHLIAGLNAIVNDGVYVEPIINMASKPETHRVISKSISKNIRSIMAKTVQNTSGNNTIGDVQVGIKAGTVQKTDGSGKMSEDVVTSVVSVFPIQDPQYIMLVVLDEPKGKDISFGLKTSAWNAVPTAGQILEQIIPVLITNK